MTDIAITPAVHVAPAHSRVPLWRRVLRSRSGLMGVVLTGIVVLAGVLALLDLTPFDPVSQRPADRFLSPDATYLMGTDQFGRDILSRVMAGAGTRRPEDGDRRRDGKERTLPTADSVREGLLDQLRNDARLGGDRSRDRPFC